MYTNLDRMIFEHNTTIKKTQKKKKEKSAENFNWITEWKNMLAFIKECIVKTSMKLPLWWGEFIRTVGH